MFNRPMLYAEVRLKVVNLQAASLSSTYNFLEPGGKRLLVISRSRNSQIVN